MGQNKEKKDQEPPLSLSTKIEQMARFLREEAKEMKSLKERKIKVLGPHEAPQVGASNSIEQIAKLLRDQVHKTQKKKAV